MRLTGVLGVGLLNGVGQILPRPTIVAMATKFESQIGHNSTSMRDTSEILRLTGGFRARAIEP